MQAPASSADRPFPEKALTASADVALGVLGDRWTTLTVLGAFVGCRRFDHWRERVGIPRSVLSNRLRRLQALGIFLKQSVSPGQRRQEYRLTPMGLDLYGWALAMRRWEMTWTLVSEHYPLYLRHRRCGALFEPRLVCAACNVAVTEPSDVLVEELRRPPQRLPLTAGRQRRSTVTAETAQGTHGYLFGECVEIVADRWSFLIVSAAFSRIVRFQALQVELGIATNILTDRLRRLEQLGVLERRRYQSTPDRFEYRLTRAGTDLYPMLLMLSNWGDRWLLAGPGGPRHRVHHLGCGQPLDLVAQCDQCGDRLVPHEVGIDHPGVALYGG